MQDNFGHRISYLRVSITDRCNERCRYCMPAEDQEWLPREDILTYEEILRIVRVGITLGIRKVRITGGEPLTRSNVIFFLRQLSELDGLEDIGLSTNGTLLARKPRQSELTFAEHVAQLGFRSVNISLDTLDRETYHQSTGRDFLTRAQEGIDAVREAGNIQLKLNCVLMRHANEAELTRLVRYAGRKDALLRFIELMPVSTVDVLHEQKFLSAGAARRIIEEEFGALEPLPDFRTNGPASYYRVPGTKDQKIGFIGAMTNLHFCETCDKLRLTCDGKLRPCLGSHLEFDLMKIIRKPGATDSEIAEHFLHVVERKPKEHDFRNDYQPNRTMIAIGG